MTVKSKKEQLYEYLSKTKVDEDDVKKASNKRKRSSKQQRKTYNIAAGEIHAINVARKYERYARIKKD